VNSLLVINLYIQYVAQILAPYASFAHIGPYRGAYDKLKIGVYFFNVCLCKQIVIDRDGSFDQFKRQLSIIKSQKIPIGGTNFEHALQFAFEFLDPLNNQTEKQLIIFSDGMPYFVDQAPECNEVINGLQPIMQTGLLDLNFNLSCLPIRATTPSSQCNPSTSGIIGLGNMYFDPKAIKAPQIFPKGSAVNPSPGFRFVPPAHDPVNFVFAMNQHLRFVRNYFTNNNVTVHTVYLSEAKCVNSVDAKRDKKPPFIVQNLEHLCREIAPNHFFNKLGEGSGGIFFRAETDSDLIRAFKKVTVQLQAKFSALDYSFKINGQVNIQQRKGEICYQHKGKIKCPLLAGESVAAVPFLGESSMVNFHLPWETYDATTKIDLEVQVKGGGKANFQIFPTYTYKDDQCGYQEIEKKQVGMKEHFLLQLSHDDFNITCKKVFDIPVPFQQPRPVPAPPSPEPPADPPPPPADPPPVYQPPIILHPVPSTQPPPATQTPVPTAQPPSAPPDEEMPFWQYLGTPSRYYQPPVMPPPPNCVIPACQPTFPLPQSAYPSTSSPVVQPLGSTPPQGPKSTVYGEIISIQ